MASGCDPDHFRASLTLRLSLRVAGEDVLRPPEAARPPGLSTFPALTELIYKVATAATKPALQRKVG